MKVATFLSGAIAALSATSASAQLMAQGLPCAGNDCLIIHVTFCGDPHLKDMDGNWYNVDGECDGALLMDNEDYDGEGNRFQLLADVKQKHGVPIVSTATLKIGDDSLQVFDDGTFVFNEEEPGLQAASAEGMTMAKSHKVIVEEKSIAAPEGSGRALTYGLLYVIFYIYCGDGVLIVISTKYDVLCITIIGAYYKIKLIVGIFGYTGGARKLEESANNAIRGAQRKLMPEVPEGCSIITTAEARRNRKNRKLAQIDEEVYNNACAGVEADEKKICAFGAMMAELEAEERA